MTPEVRKQIEEGVKEIAKKSTAPDKETPDWMETDIRRGAEFGYQLACKSSHPEQGEQGRIKQLEEGIGKFIQWMKEKRPHVSGLGAPISILESLIEGIEFYWQPKLSSPSPEGQDWEELYKSACESYREAEKENDELEKQRDHYKALAEAAEVVFNSVGDFLKTNEWISKEYNAYQSLKNQTP